MKRKIEIVWTEDYLSSVDKRFFYNFNHLKISLLIMHSSKLGQFPDFNRSLCMIENTIVPLNT